jgi:hypothetical protein
MRIIPQSIRAVGDALLLEGPKGSVLVRKHRNRIKAIYQGDQLVNGSALDYSQRLLAEAIEYTYQFPLPWQIDANGTQRITDHKRFYEQTFSPDLQGIETLKRWLHY